MNNNLKNQKGGFVKLIILIVIVIFLMSYFHVTFTGLFNWFVGVLKSVF